jgi:hypothetical protein
MIREKRKRKSSDPEKRDPEKKQRKQDGFKIALPLDTRREDDRSLEMRLRRTTPGLETEVHGKPKSKTPVIDWDEEDSSSSSGQETSTDDTLGPLKSVTQAEGRMDRGTPESFHPRRSTRVQCLEGRTEAVKKNSQTNTIMPCVKQTARSRKENGDCVREPPSILSSAREDQTLGIFARKGPSDLGPRPCGRNTRSPDDISAGNLGIEKLEKIVKGAMLKLDIFEANGGHKDPTILPTINGVLDHVMEPDHANHPKSDTTFLEWGRNTVRRCLTEQGHFMSEQVIPEIGTLARMNVGESLTSEGKGGDNPVVSGDRILYEEPNGTWNKGNISGIWRTKCGKFYYEIVADTPLQRQLRENDVRPFRDLAKKEQYTWRTIGGVQLVLRPQWSRSTDCVALNEQAIPEEDWTDERRRKHAERERVAAEKAELLQYWEETREQFRGVTGRSIRRAQRDTFDEKCNAQYLELTKKKVSQDEQRSSDTTHQNGIKEVKWCKFHKAWGFHTDETCNENPDSTNYFCRRGNKKGYSSMR